MTRRRRSRASLGARGYSIGRFDEADFGFAGSRRLQQCVPNFFIAAPSAFDGEGNGVEVDETVTAGAGWHTDCFPHVANCHGGPFEHTTLLPAVEVIEPVGVAD